MVWAIRSDLEFREQSDDGSLTQRHLEAEQLRLQSMRAGLEAVRTSGEVVEYKLRDLDEQIADLLAEIQRLSVMVPRG